jgi:hypothetical protein
VGGARIGARPPAISPQYTALRTLVRSPQCHLYVQRLNADRGPVPRRHYADDDAPDPLPLFAELPLPELPCWEFTSSIAA